MRGLLVAGALVLLGCPRPHYVAKCDWETGNDLHELDLDTREFIVRTRSVTYTFDEIGQRWREVMRGLANGLKLADEDPKHVVAAIREGVQSLQAAGCTIAYKTQLVCSGEPDEEHRRLSHVEVTWSADCPSSAFAATKERIDLLRSVFHEWLAPFLEAANRSRALLPKVDAVASRKRTIPVPPTKEESFQWRCAAEQLAGLQGSLKSMLATAAELETAAQGHK